MGNRMKSTSIMCPHLGTAPSTFTGPHWITKEQLVVNNIQCPPFQRRSCSSPEHTNKSSKPWVEIVVDERRERHGEVEKMSDFCRETGFRTASQCPPWNCISKFWGSVVERPGPGLFAERVFIQTRGSLDSEEDRWERAGGYGMVNSRGRSL